MAKQTRSSALLLSCFASLVFTSGAQAASGLDPAKAALCSAAMKIKSSETGHHITDKLTFQKAADWFSASGRASMPGSFASLEQEHRKMLEASKADGKREFTNAVNGCLTYYETSSGE